MVPSTLLAEGPGKHRRRVTSDWLAEVAHRVVGNGDQWTQRDNAQCEIPNENQPIDPTFCHHEAITGGTAHAEVYTPPIRAPKALHPGGSKRSREVSLWRTRCGGPDSPWWSLAARGGNLAVPGWCLAAPERGWTWRSHKDRNLAVPSCHTGRQQAAQMRRGIPTLTIGTRPELRSTKQVPTKPILARRASNDTTHSYIIVGYSTLHYTIHIHSKLFTAPPAVG